MAIKTPDVLPGEPGWKKLQEKSKFWLYLLVVTIITVPLESLLLKVGIILQSIFQKNFMN